MGRIVKLDLYKYATLQRMRANPSQYGTSERKAQESWWNGLSELKRMNITSECRKNGTVLRLEVIDDEE